MLDFLPYMQPYQEINYHYKPAQEIAITVGEGCGHKWFDEDAFNSLSEEQDKWEYEKSRYYLMTKVKRKGFSDDYDFHVECIPCHSTDKDMFCNSTFPKTEQEVKKIIMENHINK